MELNELQEQVMAEYEEYQAEIDSVDEKIDSMRESGVYSKGHIVGRAEEMKSEIESKFENQIVKALKMLEETAQVKVQNLQEELQPSEDYEKRQYELQQAKSIIDLLDNEQIPEHLSKINDDVYRQEFINLARAKVKDPAQKKQLGKKLLQSLSDEQREKREKLAYNQAILANKDFIDSQAITAISKVMDSQLGQAHKKQTIQNFIHHSNQKSQAIKNNIDRYILNQY